MRGNRGEPKSFTALRKELKKQEIVARQKDKINSLIWHDKKIVTFITSFGNIEQDLHYDKFKTPNKPRIIADYDKNMGGVDKFDMMVKAYFPERKNIRWTNKVSIYLVHMVVHNANALYSKFYETPDKITTTLIFGWNW